MKTLLQLMVVMAAMLGAVQTVIPDVVANGVLTLIAGGTAQADGGPTDVGCVSTTFNLTGPNDKVCVSSFSDPDVPGVLCYISQARTGGWSGAVGLAEDPSRFALSCSAAGLVTVAPSLASAQDVFSQKTSLFFKKTKVMRFIDRAHNTLVYVGYSTKVVDGSPANTLSVVKYDGQMSASR